MTTPKGQDENGRSGKKPRIYARRVYTDKRYAGRSDVDASSLMDDIVNGMAVKDAAEKYNLSASTASMVMAEERLRRPIPEPEDVHLLLDRAEAAFRDRTRGLSIAEAFKRYDIKTQLQYNQCRRITKFGNQLLIDQVNSGSLSTDCGYKFVARLSRRGGSAEELVEAYHERNEKSAVNLADRGEWTPLMHLTNLLSSTRDTWAGAANNIRLNSHTLPRNKEKIKRLESQCRAVRRAVDHMLNKIATELKQCHISRETKNLKNTSNAKESNSPTKT